MRAAVEGNYRESLTPNFLDLPEFSSKCICEFMFKDCRLLEHAKKATPWTNRNYDAISSFDKVDNKLLEVADQSTATKPTRE